MVFADAPESNRIRTIVLLLVLFFCCYGTHLRQVREYPRPQVRTVFALVRFYVFVRETIFRYKQTGYLSDNLRYYGS